MEEIWKPIPDYEGLYEISDFGNIKSLKRYRVPKDKIIKPYADTSGHMQVSLYKDGIERKIYVHKMVAFVYMGHVTDGTTTLVIDHIDEDKTNNRRDNFQIISHRENLQKHYTLNKKNENIK